MSAGTATSNFPRPSSTKPSPTPPSPRSAPALVLLEADELKRFGDLRLQLRVNGEVRQDMVVDGDMIYRPLQALQALTRFQPLDAGDLVMTGTPAGTALSAPVKADQDHRQPAATRREVEGVLQAPGRQHQVPAVTVMSWNR